MLVALHHFGPLRNLAVRKGLLDDRAIEKPGSNVARFVLTTSIEGRRFRFLNLNPRAYEIPQFIALLEALAQRYPIRALPEPRHRANDKPPLLRIEDAPHINLDGVFGNMTRTRVLLALHVLGGEYGISKLERSVLAVPYPQVRSSIHRLAEEGLLELDGRSARFNVEFACAQHVRRLLDALASGLPDVVTYADARHSVRVRHGGTARPDAIRHRLFGTRAAQAVLAYLAAYGPSRALEIAAATATKIESWRTPLIRKGLICHVTVDEVGLYSLNADHPLHRELRAILRTDQILDECFPIRPKPMLFHGRDFSDPRPPYFPNSIFGRLTEEKTATVADILGTLVHTEHQECEGNGFARVLGEHADNGLDVALQRLERMGILTSRWWKGMHLYRLNPSYGAYSELMALLLQMGRVWPEFADNGRSESETRPRRRAAMERGRSALPSSPG